VTAALLADTATVTAAVDTRTCEICSGSYHRRPRLSRAVFSTRRTCGLSCAQTLRGRGLRKPASPKTCERCGCKYLRPGMSAAEWAPRRFCGRFCSDTARTEGIVLRTCEVCSGPIPRGHRGVAEYSRRRFCNQQCMGAARRKPEPEPKPARVQAPRPTKTCTRVGCGVVFERRKGESARTFDRRRACSPTCRDLIRSSRRPKPAPKPRRQPPKPQPAPSLPAPVVQPQRPVWRPGGWTAEPQVHGAGVGR
jgi:hypothetical protein